MPQAAALVLHVDQQLAACGVSCHRHGAARPREFEGVVKQVGNGGADQAAVSAHRQAQANDMQRKLAVFRLLVTAHRPFHVAQQVIDLDEVVVDGRGRRGQCVDDGLVHDLPQAFEAAVQHGGRGARHTGLARPDGRKRKRRRIDVHAQVAGQYGKAVVEQLLLPVVADQLALL